MPKFVRTLLGDERGATFVYVAVSLPVIIGFAGLGVDVAMWQLDKRHAQEMADAAVVAASVSVIRTNSMSSITTYATEAAELNGFDAGGGDTIGVYNPPISGPLSPSVYGDPDSNGISGEEESIEVQVRLPTTSFFSTIIDDTQRYVSARAVAQAINDPGDVCMMSLDPTGAINVSGTATVGLDCGALSNGDLVLNGGACLTATSVRTVGTADDNACSTDSVPAVTRPDPLRHLPKIEDRNCNKNSPTVVTNGEIETFYTDIDGVFVFCGDITVNNGGTLILMPGVYVLHGANLSVSGTLMADGVMLYVSELASSSDAIQIAGAATVTWNALTPGDIDPGDIICKTNQTQPAVECIGSGSYGPATDLDEIYEGIAVFGDRDQVDGINYNFAGGSDMNINGVIYLPGGDVSWAGGSDGDAKAILADNITVTGNSSFGTVEGTILEELLAYVFVKMVE